MNTHLLGNSDLRITRFGFSAWAAGGGGWQFGWSTQDDHDSIAAIHSALELGINWIDTAAAYGLGHSEEIVAKALGDWPGAKPYVLHNSAVTGAIIGARNATQVQDVFPHADLILTPEEIAEIAG
jgi:aryl-alcohol dehydrogenase-like predicted oxidoreductase